MVMLIASIVSLVLIVAIYLFITVFGIRFKHNSYELITGNPRWPMLVGHVFITIGVAFVGLSFIDILESAAPTCLVGGDFLAFIGLAFFYSFIFQFEAIKGGSIFLLRFIKVKEIQIKDIAFINPIFSGYIFTCKDGSAFSISAKTLRVKEFIEMVEKRMENNSSTEEQVSKDESSVQKTSLSQIGKEIRNMIPSIKKNSRYLFIVLAALFLMTTGVLAVLGVMQSNRFLLIFAILCCLVGMVPALIITFTTDKRYENDLKQDDEYLGKKYLFLSKDVKGSAKRRFKNNLVSGIITVICLVLMAVVTGIISSLQNPVEKEDIVYVTGEFEYARNVRDDYAIGLKGNPVEYRISSIELHETDRSFKEELHAGDTVYLYVDGTRENASISYQDKTAWNFAYVFKTDSKTYLSYEGYLRANESNRRLGVIMCYVCSGVAALSLGAIVVAYVKYKSDAKKERIEL
jgi:hypothetical protein